MKKNLMLFLFFMVAMTFGLGSAFAMPAAKATAQLGDLSVVPADGTWKQIFSQKRKNRMSK